MDMCTYIDAQLHKAAIKGKLKPFKDYQEPLDTLLTPNENTILHIYLTSQTEICTLSMEELKELNISRTRFINEVLVICPSLLWKVNVDGNTLLHIAARYGLADVAKELIQWAPKALAGDEILDLESGGEEPREAVKRMLRMTNKYKETALHEAARNEGSLDVVKAILGHEDGEFTYSANDGGKTPLYLAAENGSAKTVLELLSNPNSKSLAYGGPSGKTALHAAAINSKTSPEMIDKLLDKWSSLTRETDEKGWTPLHYAVYKGYTSMVEKLLEKDESSACIGDKDWKRTPLHIAACRGLHHKVDKIISRCPNCCELVDIRGWNVLHYAVISQSDKLLRTLLKHSSLVYLLYGKDIKGNMPVHLYKAYYPLSVPISLQLFNLFHQIKLGFDRHNLFFHWLELYSQVPEYSSSEKSEYLEWMNSIGTGPLGEIENEEEKRQENLIIGLEKVKDSHLVASTLVATITFAGAFTIPGGYISDEKSLQNGAPILSKNLAFKAFIISDSMAMVLSTGAVFIHLMLAILKYQKGNFWLIKCAYISLFYAIVAMLIAFVTGTYSFLTPPMGISICAIGSTFFLFLYYSMMRIMFVDIWKGDEIFQAGFFLWLTGFAWVIITIIIIPLSPILGFVFVFVLISYSIVNGMRVQTSLLCSPFRKEAEPNEVNE